MFLDDLIGWTTMSRIQAIPYTVPFVSSVCYLPEIRSSVSLYLVQSRYRQVSLLVTVIHNPVTNYLVTLSSLRWRITEWARRYLSVTRSDKSQSRSMSTQQTPSEIPVEYLYSHPVTLRRLAHTKHSYGVSELHDLMVIGTYTWHAEHYSDNCHDQKLCLTFGSRPSHHSPNDVIPLSNDNSCLWLGNLNHLWSTS